jgi:signal transduction histidine kinase
MDFSNLTRGGHFGLAGMRERAEAIGAEFTVSSEPGKGTTIVVTGPFNVKNMK